MSSVKTFKSKWDQNVDRDTDPNWLTDSERIFVFFFKKIIRLKHKHNCNKKKKRKKLKKISQHADLTYFIDIYKRVTEKNGRAAVFWVCNVLIVHFVIVNELHPFCFKLLTVGPTAENFIKSGCISLTLQFIIPFGIIV